MGQMLRMGLQNGPGTERQIGMEIVCLQNGTGGRDTEADRRNTESDTGNTEADTGNTEADTGNPESDRQENGIR